MSTTTAHRRALAATAALAAAFFTIIPTAVASPKPEPQPSQATGCPVDVPDFAAQLRAAGLTAQAANNAAQLSYRHCVVAGLQG
jgi:hypothetical protein